MSHECIAELHFNGAKLVARTWLRKEDHRRQTGLAQRRNLCMQSRGLISYGNYAVARAPEPVDRKCLALQVVRFPWSITGMTLAACWSLSVEGHIGASRIARLRRVSVSRANTCKTSLALIDLRHLLSDLTKVVETSDVTSSHDE